MNDSIYWLTSSQTVLVLTMPIYWTWDEMRALLAEISLQLDLCESPITVVIDFQNSPYIPPNINQNIKPILLHLHPMADPIILTRVSTTHRAVLNMLFRLYPKDSQRWAITDTLEELVVPVA